MCRTWCWLLPVVSQLASTWPLTLQLARLVEWASIYHGGPRGPRESDILSCHVSKSLVSEVTQHRFLYILLVKSSHQRKRNKLHIVMEEEAKLLCKRA